MEFQTNSAKSLHGSNLNSLIKDLLMQHKEASKIKDFKTEPRYSFPNHDEKQFSPDFEITLNNGDIIVIDNTTTARHDRFKQKQWDANGIKKYYLDKGINIKYYVILPDDDVIGNENSRAKEIRNYHHEKTKITNPHYYSMVDDIIQVSNFVGILNAE